VTETSYDSLGPPKKLFGGVRVESLPTGPTAATLGTMSVSCLASAPHEMEEQFNSTAVVIAEPGRAAGTRGDKHTTLPIIRGFMKRPSTFACKVALLPPGRCVGE
jgi:hypothetical protein